MRPRIIFVDCWYTSEVLPVILAAHRCGIPTVDLQHGIQGASHFGYASWSKVEDSRFLPGTFWLWGDQDREVFENPENDLNRYAEARVGGSIELNYLKEMNRGNSVHQEDVNGRIRVLVTEQKDIEIIPTLRPVMEQTVGKISWLVRPHPGQAESAFRGMEGFPGLDLTFIPPDQETVFESLARADIHLTGFSSVALEALAFDVRTVLVHEAGREIFAPYIEKELMTLVLDAVGLLNALRDDGRPKAGSFEEAVRKTFAPLEATRATLHSLLNDDPGIGHRPK